MIEGNKTQLVFSIKSRTGFFVGSPYGVKYIQGRAGYTAFVDIEDSAGFEKRHIFQK